MTMAESMIMAVMTTAMTTAYGIYSDDDSLWDLQTVHRTGKSLMKALHAVIDAIKNGDQTILQVAATGGSKTLSFMLPK